MRVKFRGSSGVCQLPVARRRDWEGLSEGFCKSFTRAHAALPELGPCPLKLASNLRGAGFGARGSSSGARECWTNFRGTLHRE